MSTVSLLRFQLESLTSPSPQTDQPARLHSQEWNWQYSSGRTRGGEHREYASLASSAFAIPCFFSCIALGLLSFLLPCSLLLLKPFFRSKDCDVRVCSCWVLSWAKVRDCSLLHLMQFRLHDPIADVRRNALRAVVHNRKQIAAAQLPAVSPQLLFDAIEVDAISDLGEQIHSYFACFDVELLEFIPELFALEQRRSTRSTPFDLAQILKHLESAIDTEQLCRSFLMALSKDEFGSSRRESRTILEQKKSIASQLARISLRLKRDSALRAEICAELYLLTLDSRYSTLREAFAHLADMLHQTEP